MNSHESSAETVDQQPVLGSPEHIAAIGTLMNDTLDQYGVEGRPAVNNSGKLPEYRGTTAVFEDGDDRVEVWRETFKGEPSDVVKLGRYEKRENKRDGGSLWHFVEGIQYDTTRKTLIHVGKDSKVHQVAQDEDGDTMRVRRSSRFESKPTPPSTDVIGAMLDATMTKAKEVIDADKFGKDVATKAAKIRSHVVHVAHTAVRKLSS